jgi:hypothetical protein
VGIPSLCNDRNDRYHGYVASALAHAKAALGGVDFEVFVSPPSGKPGIEGVVECQNFLVAKALASGCDYLWLVQADVQVPVNAFRDLLSLDVDVAQGVVSRHDDREALICGFLDIKRRVWYLPRSAVEGQVLSGWVFAGMSCTLIKRRALEAGIRFRYQRGIGEDILFMYDVQKMGFVARVDGRVLCGHLPEWPLASLIKDCGEPVFEKLDVGCGHRPTGDVNVDLFPEPSAHRCLDQRVNDDVALHVHEISNFVRADACRLPFRECSFRKCTSWHLIEHLVDPELFLREMMRVSAEEIEVRCPNGEYLSCRDETKPLHLHNFSVAWFQEKLGAYSDWDFAVRWGYSQSEPWEIIVEGFRKGNLN